MTDHLVDYDLSDDIKELLQFAKSPDKVECFLPVHKEVEKVSSSTIYDVFIQKWLKQVII